MTNVLSRLGNNFLVAAFIPALAFVLAAQLLFSPLDPAGSNSRFLVPRSLEEGILTVVLALIAGFTMMGLMTFNYKLLEGYMVLERASFMRRRQYRKAFKRQLEYKTLDRMVSRLTYRYRRLNAKGREEDNERLESYEMLLQKLRQKDRAIKASYKEDYPVQVLGGVLPTRFGNIFKSAEQYPLENYGIDSVRLWPRLVHVIAPDYDNRLDASNNNLAFLVNCMAFSILLSALCLLASIWHLFAGSSTMLTQVTAGETRYLLGAIFFLLLGIFFYHAALPAARQYNNLVRSAFDLFRFDLLESLHLDLPSNNPDEKRLWTEVSDFIAVSNLAAPEAKAYLEYRHLAASSGFSDYSRQEATTQATDESST